MNYLSSVAAKKLSEKVKNLSGIDININEYPYVKSKIFTDCIFFGDKKGNKFIISENGYIFDLPYGIFTYFGEEKWGFICKNKFFIYQTDKGFTEHNPPKGYSFILNQSTRKYDYDDAYSKIEGEWIYSFEQSYNDFRVEVKRFGYIAIIEKKESKALFSLEKLKILVDGIDGEIYTGEECVYSSGKTPCDDEYRNYTIYYKRGKRHELSL